MKKIIILLSILLIAVNSYALQDGLYEGEFLMAVSNPNQCAPYTSGYTRITNLGDSNILYQNVISWNENEVVITEKTCVTNGISILCPPIDQVFEWWGMGLDATITNHASHGAGKMVAEDEFIMNYSVRRWTCEGEDCETAKYYMFGEEGGFPCNIGPMKTKFVRIAP